MSFATIAIVGGSVALASSGAGIISGASRTKKAKQAMSRLESKEPSYNIPDFYKQNIAKAEATSQQQMDLAKQMAGMGTDYAKQLQAQQEKFSTEYMAQAEKGASDVERLGKMAMQRGLGPSAQMGADLLAQQTASAFRGATDRRMGGALAGSIVRQQQQGIQGLVAQDFAARSQGLGQYMGAKQYGAGLRQQALGTTYQTGLQAGQLGYGAQMQGLQGVQQAGLTGFQLGERAGGMLAQQELMKQQADWEKWANQYQSARADLQQGRAQTSGALNTLAQVGGQAMSMGFGGVKAGKGKTTDFSGLMSGGKSKTVSDFESTYGPTGG